MDLLPFHQGVHRSGDKYTVFWHTRIDSLTVRGCPRV